MFQVSPACISDIIFSRSDKTSTSSDSSVPAAKQPKISQPSDLEMNNFFRKIDKAQIKPALLRVVEPFAEDFIPRLSTDKLPKPLTDLYNPDALRMDYLKLLDSCESVFQSIKVRLSYKLEIKYL